MSNTIELKDPKYEFEIDNGHPFFKGTEYENRVFGMSIDLYNWQLKASIRAGIEAAIELGTPPQLKPGEVDDITTPEGMHRYTYSKMVNAYAVTKYKFAVTIKDWYGFTAGGVEQECNEENILKFLKGDADFFDIVYKIMEVKGEKTAEEKVVDDALGNSLAGSDGTTEAPTEELE